MIDALCHLPLFPTADEAVRALDAAAAAGVTDVICAGTDPRLPEVAPASTDGRVRIHRAYGVHPEFVSADHLDEQLAALERKLDKGDVVAVGECGLDHRDHMPPLELQLRALSAQIAVAARRKLPLIVHAVRSPARIVQVMKAAHSEHGVRWVWHGFGDSLEIAREAVAAGAVISVGALIHNPGSRRLHETIAGLAGDLLLETDAPHAPSSTLLSIAHEIARLRGLSINDVVDGSIRAARGLFRLGVSAEFPEQRG